MKVLRILKKLLKILKSVKLLYFYIILRKFYGFTNIILQVLYI